jgi:hypothetical protein
MRRTAAAVIAAALLVLPAAAIAKVVKFAGTATGDSETKVSFAVKGHMKRVPGRRAKFVADQVSEIAVENQQFTCYRADGSPSNPLVSGRETYNYNEIAPIKVKKNGRFSGEASYTTPGGNSPTYRYVFKGRITGRKATGTYRTQHGVGGIAFGYCGDKTPVPWKAKG